MWNAGVSDLFVNHTIKECVTALNVPREVTPLIIKHTTDR